MSSSFVERLDPGKRPKFPSFFTRYGCLRLESRKEAIPCLPLPFLGLASTLELHVSIRFFCVWASLLFDLVVGG